jgi:hypothetical protein
VTFLWHGEALAVRDFVLCLVVWSILGLALSQRAASAFTVLVLSQSVDRFGEDIGYRDVGFEVGHDLFTPVVRSPGQIAPDLLLAVRYGVDPVFQCRFRLSAIG